MATSSCVPSSTPPRFTRSSTTSRRVFDTFPPERGRADKDEFRYEMLNRSAAVPGRGRAPAILEVDRAAARRRLPRDREHRVAQPARVRRRPVALRRRSARAPPRGRAVGRPDPVPGVRDRRAHLSAGLHARRRPDRGRARQPPVGPARAVRPHERRRPHLRRPPARCCSRSRPATSRSSSPTPGTAACRRGGGGRGRYFLQVHYGRRDIAQRIRTTDVVNQLSPEAIARARRPTARARARRPPRPVLLRRLIREGSPQRPRRSVSSTSDPLRRVPGTSMQSSGVPSVVEGIDVRQVT